MLESGIQLESRCELLVCFLLVADVFKVEKGEAESKLGAVRELFESSFEHSFYLFDELGTVIGHSVFVLLLAFLNLEWTVKFIANLFVTFNVADEEHHTVLVFFLVNNQFQNKS